MGAGRGLVRPCGHLPAADPAHPARPGLPAEVPPRGDRLRRRRANRAGLRRRAREDAAAADDPGPHPRDGRGLLGRGHAHHRPGGHLGVGASAGPRTGLVPRHGRARRGLRARRLVHAAGPRAVRGVHHRAGADAARHDGLPVRRAALRLDLQAPGRGELHREHGARRLHARHLQQLARLLRSGRMAERVRRRRPDHVRRLGSGLLLARRGRGPAVRAPGIGDHRAGALDRGLALRRRRLDQPELLRPAGTGLPALARGDRPVPPLRPAAGGGHASQGPMAPAAPGCGAHVAEEGAPGSRPPQLWRRRSRPERRSSSGRSCTSPSS